MSLKRKRTDDDPPNLDLFGSTKIVKFRVGSDKIHAMVREKLFREAVEATKYENIEKVVTENEELIKLEHCDQPTFGLLLKYLYNRSIDDATPETLIKARVTATKLHMRGFRRDLLHALGELHKRQSFRFTELQLKYIYENTDPCDCLRRLCTRIVGLGIVTGKYTFDDEGARELIKPFMGELMAGVLAGVKVRTKSTAQSPSTTVESKTVETINNAQQPNSLPVPGLYFRSEQVPSIPNSNSSKVPQSVTARASGNVLPPTPTPAFHLPPRFHTGLFAHPPQSSRLPFTSSTEPVAVASNSLSYHNFSIDKSRHSSGIYPAPWDCHSA